MPRLRDIEVAQSRDNAIVQILRGHFEFSRDGTTIMVYLKREKKEEPSGRTYKRRTKKKIIHELLNMV